MARKNLGDAFGGKITTLEEQRAIWLDAGVRDPFLRRLALAAAIVR